MPDVQDTCSDCHAGGESVVASEDERAYASLFEAQITDDARDGQGAAGVDIHVKVADDIFAVDNVARVGGGGGPALELEKLAVTCSCNGQGIGDRNAIGKFKDAVAAGEGGCAGAEGIVVTYDDLAPIRDDCDAAREGVVAAEGERANAGFSEAEGAADHAADGESVSTDCDGARGVHRHRTGSHAQVARAGVGEIPIPVLCVVVGEGDVASTGVVEHATCNRQGAGADGCVVIDGKRAGAERGGAGVGVGSREDERAGAVFD